MSCRVCGHEASPGAQHCTQCGQNLNQEAVTCTVCGNYARPNDRFCSGCGSLLSKSKALHGADTSELMSLHRLMPREYVELLMSASGRARSERRIVTILFVDVVGSTAMGENLDPEHVLEIMNAAFARLMEPVFRYEGTLARLTGDGLLCFFGAPIAHEDDSERACRAALEIIEASKAFAAWLEREHGISGFAVRVGINTGLVVVGEVGSDLRVEYTAMGDAVNLAARIESHAQPGTVLVSDATAQRIANAFDLEDCGTFEIRGKRTSVRLQRLIRFRGNKPQPLISGLQSPLVGRQRELSVLRLALDGLHKEQGCRVVITGEPGLGKSRLLCEARSFLPDHARWVEARGSSYSERTAYAIVTELLCGLTGIEQDAAADTTADMLRKWLIELFRPTSHDHPAASPEDSRELIERTYAHLSCLMGIHGGDVARHDVAHPPGAALHKNVANALRIVIDRLAARKPLVLVFEDLHWADYSSISILRALLSLPEQAPVVMLLVFRAGEGSVGDFHQHVISAYKDRTHLLSLMPLTKDESIEMLTNLLTLENNSNEVIEAIVNSTDGNALFLEEIVRSFVDSDVLVRQGHGFATRGTVTAFQVPESVYGVVMSRIDRLAPREKRVLQTASVIGRSFHHEVLTAALHGETPPDALNESLAELVRREFLLQEQPGQAVLRPSDTLRRENQEHEFGAEYRFKHAITADVSYQSLLRSERRQLHKLVGETWERHFASRLDEHAAALAAHFEEAGHREKAISYWIRAGDRALRLYACHESRDAYREALKLLSRDSESGDLTTPLLAHVCEGLGDSLYKISEYAEAVEEFCHALAILEDPYRRAAVYRKCGESFEKWGRYDKAREAFEAGLAEMGGMLDEGEAARIYSGLCLIHYHAADYDAAIELGNLALAMMGALENEQGMAQAYNNLGVVHTANGDFTRAAQSHADALRLWQQLGDMYGLAATYNNLGLVAHKSGNPGAAIEHLEESRRLFDKLGNLHGVARVLDNLGQVYSEQDQAETAMEYVKQALRILTEITHVDGNYQPEMWQSGTW